MSSDATDDGRWPTPEQAVEALDASGHLLEQQVATRLEALGYSVLTSRSLSDADEGECPPDAVSVACAGTPNVDAATVI